MQEKYDDARETTCLKGRIHFAHNLKSITFQKCIKTAFQMRTDL